MNAASFEIDDCKTMNKTTSHIFQPWTVCLNVKYTQETREPHYVLSWKEADVFFASTFFQSLEGGLLFEMISSQD